MIHARTIERLGLLLDRVRARSAEPRLVKTYAGPSSGAVAVPASAPRAGSPVEAPSSAVAPSAVAPSIPPPPSEPTRSVSAHGYVAYVAPESTPPPAESPRALQLDAPFDEPALEPSLTRPTQPPPSYPDGELVVDVDLAEPAQDTTRAAVVSVEEGAPAGDGLGSRERLVAADPATPESTSEHPTVAASPSSAPEMDVTGSAHVEPGEASDVVEGEIVAEAVGVAPLEDAAEPEPHESARSPLEEPPASSRRVLEPPPEEDLARMAFGVAAPRPPRHTPPPESGRLPAGPAEEFEAEEGATGEDFDRDVTGVREAHVVEENEVDVLHADDAARLSATDAPALDLGARELVPETTRPQLVSGEVVSDVIGRAQRFAPATFVVLLDASLAL